MLFLLASKAPTWATLQCIRIVGGGVKEKDAKIILECVWHKEQANQQYRPHSHAYIVVGDVIHPALRRE